jgi:hypothetical protein
MRLVEDSPAEVLPTREALKLQLELHGAENGGEAMEFLHRSGAWAAAPRPGRILLDLKLPRKDGREVRRDIPADEDVRGDYGLCAYGAIPKPVDFESFVSGVRSIQPSWFTSVPLPGRSGALPPALQNFPRLVEMPRFIVGELFEMIGQPHFPQELGLRRSGRIVVPGQPLRIDDIFQHALRVGFLRHRSRSHRGDPAKSRDFIRQILCVPGFIGDFAGEKLFEFLPVRPGDRSGILKISDHGLVLAGEIPVEQVDQAVFVDNGHGLVAHAELGF